MTFYALYSVCDRRCLPETKAILYHVRSVYTDSSLSIVSSSIEHAQTAYSTTLVQLVHCHCCAQFNIDALY